MATNRGGLQPSARGGFQPSDRGGLQPAPEERNAFGVLRDFFYQARDTLGRHKDKVEALIEQLEKTLATKKTATSALRRIIKNLENAWIEMEAQYDRLHDYAAGQGRLQGLQVYHATLQRRYLEVRARAQDALNNDEHRSRSRNC